MINTSSEYIFNYRGKNVIDTKHSIDRRYERVKKGEFYLSEKELVSFFKNIIDYLISRDAEWVDIKETEILFFSKSLDQGIVIAYRRDYRDKKGEKHPVIITYLPRGRSNPKPGTVKVLLESLSSPDYFLNLFHINNINEEECYDYWKKSKKFGDKEITLYFSRDTLIDCSIPIIEIE